MTKTEKKDIIKIDDLSFIKYIKASEIDSHIQTLASAITRDYHDKNPLFLAVLNGAFVFASDLVRKFDFICEISFARIKSYQGTQSTGNADIYLPHGLQIKDRHIILVEDIIDTGNTVAALLPILEKYEPKSISLAALLVKPEAHKHNINIDYPGIVIPNKFVVGYGLDYNEKGRNLPDLYQLYQP